MQIQRATTTVVLVSRADDVIVRAYSKVLIGPHGIDLLQSGNRRMRQIKKSAMQKSLLGA